MTTSSNNGDKKKENVGHIHGPHCDHGHGYDDQVEHEKPKQLINEGPKIGRNDPCSCGSQKKFKKCCGK